MTASRSRLQTPRKSRSSKGSTTLRSAWAHLRLGAHRRCGNRARLGRWKRPRHRCRRTLLEGTRTRRTGVRRPGRNGCAVRVSEPRSHGHRCRVGRRLGSLREPPLARRRRNRRRDRGPGPHGNACRMARSLPERSALRPGMGDLHRSRPLTCVRLGQRSYICTGSRQRWKRPPLRFAGYRAGCRPARLC